MKKKVLGVIAVVAVAAIAGYNVYTSQNDVKLSDLVLSNVEALANAKEGGNECIGCVYTRLQICRSGGDKSLYVVVGIICLFISTFSIYNWNTKSSSALLLCNVDALANNAEVDFDFCVVTSGICVIYSDGLAIRGYKLYQ